MRSVNNMAIKIKTKVAVAVKVAAKVTPPDPDQGKVDMAPGKAIDQPPPKGKVEADTSAFDLDSELGVLADCTPEYGVDLVGAMDNLMRLVAKEGVELKDLRDGFNKVNAILLANPSLCTEIMLPTHLGKICHAARKLSAVSIEEGTARKTKAATKRKTKEEEAKVALDAEAYF